MRQSQLRRYDSLYLSARWYGAADILRRYIGVGEEYVIPLALPHGVDFGQVAPVMDIAALEPIHWAHNRSILEAAAPFKPAVAIPHPFLLAMETSSTPKGRGTLIVGPPPGPENDRKLYEVLARDGLLDGTVLVKVKQNSEHSVRYWKELGFKTATLADGGPPDYERLVPLLGSYERVVGCTFSSALIFAAALGKEIQLLRGYRYRAYEVAEIERLFAAGSPAARAFVGVFAAGSTADTTAAARQLLGAELELAPQRIKASLDAAVELLVQPLYFATGYPRLLKSLLAELALRSGKPGIVSRRFTDVVTDSRRRMVTLQEIDEIALWLDGPTRDNPRNLLVPYIPKITVPGDPVERYPDGPREECSDHAA